MTEIKTSKLLKTITKRCLCKVLVNNENNDNSRFLVYILFLLILSTIGIQQLLIVATQDKLLKGKEFQVENV